MIYLVTGIDTDVGKTVVSAILVEALQADYWKPVQCGWPRDTETVASLVSNEQSTYFQEQWLLEEPASPHQAAANQGITLSLSEIQVPNYRQTLIMEGAGGLMVPLNQHEYILDLAKKCADGVILVAKLYLGSINHTIMTIDLLRQHRLPLAGIVFNGPPNKHSESIILDRAEAPALLHLAADSDINPENIKLWAQELRDNWN